MFFCLKKASHSSGSNHFGSYLHSLQSGIKIQKIIPSHVLPIRKMNNLIRSIAEYEQLTGKETISMTSHMKNNNTLTFTYTYLQARACANVNKNRRIDVWKGGKHCRTMLWYEWSVQSIHINLPYQIKPHSTNFEHYSSFTIIPTNQSSILNIFCRCRQMITLNS